VPKIPKRAALTTFDVVEILEVFIELQYGQDTIGVGFCNACCIRLWNLSVLFFSSSESTNLLSTHTISTIHLGQIVENFSALLKKCI